MKIRNILHQGLRLLIENDEAAALPADAVPKLRRIVAFLQAMETEDALRNVPTWKAHRLTGARKGVWALHIERNWRLSFKIDQENFEIMDLDYEDYH